MRDAQDITKELGERWGEYKAALDGLAERPGEAGRGGIYEAAVKARNEIDRLLRELADRLRAGGP